LKPFASTLLIALLLLQGCHSGTAGSAESAATANLPPPPAPAPVTPTPNYDDDVIATVQGDKITRRDLDPVLMEGYGLNVLLTLVQLDLAEQEATRQHLTVTPQDIASEREITMQNLRHATEAVDSTGQPTTEPENLTAGQEDQLLDQILQQQHVSRAEFNVILQINANLRKIAEPKVEASLTEDRVRAQFDATYGEKALVHYIQCNSMTEVTEVRRELAAGKSFEDVARERSVDRLTGPAGGALPPFSRQDPHYPPEIKDVVFDLKPGEVSDPVQHGQFIYIFKLIQKIPPAHARFEDYKADVKKDLYNQTVMAAMKLMRDELAREAMASLRIKDPVLQQQWMDRLDQKTNQVRDENQIRQELDQQHAPATMPATAP
jgi:foldase protein PrsA